MPQVLGTTKLISGFDPRSIVGLQLWLDGSDTATMNSTPTVTTWSDKSGNANNMTGTATYSGGTMTFNGSTQAFSNTAYVFPSNAYSMFAVYSNTTAPAASAYMNAVYGNGGYPMLGTYDTGKLVSARSVVGNTGALGQTTTATANGWAAQIDGTTTSSDIGRAVATDSSGNVFVTGSYGAALTLYNTGGGAGAALAFTGALDGFLAKYSSAGSVVWATRIAGTTTSSDVGQGVATDSSGNVFVTGYYSAALTLYNTGGGTGATLTNAIGNDAFLAKYSSAGSVVWATQIAGTSSDIGQGVATDSSGNVFVTGYYQAALTLYNTGGGAGAALAFTGGNDAFLAKYSSAGSVLWATRIAGTTTSDDRGYGVATDSSGNVFVTGQYRAALTLYDTGGSTSTSLPFTGGIDCFLAKYSSTGFITGTTTTITGSGYPASSNVLVDGTYVPSSFSPYVNGSNVTALSGTVAAATGLFVGGPSNYFNGSISEVLVYSSNLTSTQRQTIEGYLAWKWGIKPSLPTTHPFYSLPAFSRPFGPTDIPGCALWLDAADASTFTFSSGSNISNWKDKSPNGFTGTSSGSPTLVTNSQNGLQVVNFVASSSQYFNFGNVLPLTQMTLFVVGKTTFVSGTAQSFIARSLYGVQDGRWAMIYETNYLFFITGGGGSGYTASATATPYSGTFSLFEGVWDGTSVYSYGNGTQLASVSASVTATSNSDLVLVGAYNNASGGVPPQTGFYYNGTIGEIIMFSNALSTGQRQQVEGYLAAKWGLLNNLPGRSLSPLNIPGCALWLDAADQSSTSMTLSGSSVTTWKDKSGNGRDLTASGSYPTITSNGVLFNGATPNVLSNATAFTAVNGINSFVVFNSTVASSRQRMFMYVYNGQKIGYTADTTYNSVFSGTVGGDGPVSYSANTTYLYGGNTYSSSPFISHSENGVETQYPSTYTVNASTQTQLLVGGQSTVYFTGTIKEVILYDAFITASQRQSVENYLMSKWGISNVTTHPFKSIPPSTSQPPQFQEVTPGNWKYDWQPYLQSLTAANSGATASISSYSVSGSAANYPHGYGALAPNGLIYFIGGYGVYVLNPSTNTASVIGAMDTNQYSGLVLGTNGNLYGIPYGAGTVVVITPSSSSPYGTVTTIGSGLDSYQGGCLGPNGTIYALPWTGSNLLTINTSTNTVTQIAISPRTTTRGSVVGPDGNIYGAPWGTSLILKINPSTNTSSTIACNNKTYWGASLGPNGLIYFSPFDPGSILCLNVVGNIVTNVGSSANYYAGLVLGPNGKLYSAPYNSSILEYNISSNTTSTYSYPFLLNNSASMILAPNGNIYVGVTNSNGYYISFSGLKQLPNSNYCLSAYTNKF